MDLGVVCNCGGRKTSVLRSGGFYEVWSKNQNTLMPRRVVEGLCVWNEITSAGCSRLPCVNKKWVEAEENNDISEGCVWFWVFGASEPWRTIPNMWPTVSPARFGGNMVRCWKHSSSAHLYFKIVSPTAAGVVWVCLRSFAGPRWGC